MYITHLRNHKQIIDQISREMFLKFYLTKRNFFLNIARIVYFALSI